MPTIAVHVGAHKTGTSLIQKYLRDKPEQILPYGIRVISRSDTNGLIGWGAALIDTPEKLANRLEAETAAGTTVRYVVASHENTLGRPHRASGDYLYPESPTRIEALAKVLTGWDAKVIVYLRPQAPFLESYYLQLVQQGETFTFDQWLDRVDFDRVSWRPLIEMLDAAFGRDRVEVGDFEEIRQGQEAFLQGFFRRIDPSIDFAPEYAAQRNLSISEKGLRIALAANPYLRTPDEKKGMRVFLQRRFSNADYPRAVLFTPGQRADLEVRYGAEYRSLIRPR